MHLPKSHPLTTISKDTVLETSLQLGLVAHTYNPSSEGWKRKTEFRVSLGYIARPCQRETIASKVLFQHQFQRGLEREGYSPKAALGSAAVFALEKGVALSVLFPFVSPSRGFPPETPPNPENPPPPEGTTKPLKPLKAPPPSD